MEMDPESDRADETLDAPTSGGAGDRVKDLFEEASELPGNEREAFLRDRCGGDAELRRAVESLLAAHEQAGGFLASPTAATAAGAPSPDARVGQVIGRYKLLQPIGEGGFGTVFMAEQQRPVRRMVALKIIKLGMDTKQVVARFEAERQALAMMDHPNIAKVLDGGATDDGRPYFVMELVNGVPVTEYCDANRLTARERLELFVPMCQAVQHAHQKGIIHRDLKPSNVLVTLHDGRPMPKVIDFGIAKATQARLTERTLFTEFRQMIGTPQYMSPEQAEMTGLGVDTRSDVYSLGVMLYELLTGTTPLDARELRSKAYGEMQRMIREDDPPSPSTRLSTMGQLLPTVIAQRRTDARQLGRQLRGDLDWIVMKCLEKDRARRYESASGLAADVLHYLADEPVSAAKPSVAYRVRKFARRYRLQVGAAAAVLASLAIGLVVSSIGYVSARRAEGFVRRQKEVVTAERDRAVRAEVDADGQRRKAEAEARRAQQQVAEGLISQGDALTSAADFPLAYARYGEARAELERLGSPLARLDLSLVRLFRASPPPLWTAQLAGERTRAWAVLPGRNEVITMTGEDAFQVWDLLTGTLLRTVGDARRLRCLVAAASADGPVVVAGGGLAVAVLDPVTGNPVRRADDDRAAAFCALSGDGSLAASTNEADTLTLWETATLNKLALGSPPRDVKAKYAAFSHDGNLLATLSGDRVTLWDLKTRREVRTIDEANGRRKARGGNTCLTFSADDRALFCAELDGVISAFTVEGAPLATWVAHNGKINSLAVTPDGSRLITSANDGRVRVFDASFSGAWDPSLSMVTDGSLVIGAAYVGDTGAKACDASRGLAAADQGVAVAVSLHGQMVAWPLVAPSRFAGRMDDGISVSADGLLVAGKAGGRTEVRDVATGRTLRTFPVDSGLATAFSADGARLYAGRKVLSAFDLAADRCLWSVNAHDGDIWSLDASADGTLVASGGDDGRARVWDARAGTLLYATRDHGGGDALSAVLFAPDRQRRAAPGTQPALAGRRLVTGGQGTGLVHEWDLAGTAQPRRTYASGPIRGLSYSPDGKLLVAATVANRATVFNAETYERAGQFGPVNSFVYAVRHIDPGTGPGAWAVVCCYRDLYAWDATTRKERLLLDTMTGYGNGTTAARPAYANNTLAASADGTVVVAKGTGRINFTLPRRYRELVAGPTNVLRAGWYAEAGLWQWTREMLRRERSAGRDVPALLSARAAWACGDYEAARKAFDVAAARGEAPAWYAALCASVGDAPLAIAPLAPSARPPDPGADPAPEPPRAEGTLSAADLPALRALIGGEVTVEGVVSDSVWSASGKVMNVQFAGDARNKVGLLCVVFAKQRQAFDAAFAGDAAAAFTGARLRVQGKLTLYRGAPELILDDPGKVTIAK